MKNFGCNDANLFFVINNACYLSTTACGRKKFGEDGKKTALKYGKTEWYEFAFYSEKLTTQSKFRHWQKIKHQLQHIRIQNLCICIPVGICVVYY